MLAKTKFIFTKFYRLAKENPLVSLLLLALLLRLPLLNGSFWLDEAAQALESSRRFSEQLQIENDFQPPLIHLLTFFALRVSAAEWWLRTVVALVPGMVSIWGTYQVGKKLISKEAGLVAGLILSTSSFHVFYSQELRPYSLPTMWVVLSWMVFLNLVGKKTKILKLWLGYLLLVIAGLFSSYLFGFALLAQLVTLIVFYRKRIPNFFAAWIGAGVLSSWWLSSFFAQLRVGQSWRTILPGWEKVVSLPQLKALPLTMGKFWFGVLDIEPSYLYILVTSLILLGIIVGLLSKKITKNFVIICLWLVVPLIASWLISFAVPVIRPKRLLFLMPAWSLFVAEIYHQSRFRHKIIQYLISFWLALILLINLFSLVSYWQVPALQRENWRDLVDEIQTDYPAHNSIVIFSFPTQFSPWDWYADEEYPILPTHVMHVSMVPDLSAGLAPATEYRHILVFDYLRDLTDPNDEIIKVINSYGYSQVTELDYPNIGFVRVFMRQNDLISLQ